MVLCNGLHLLISLASRFIVTGLVAQAERRPARAHLVGLAIVMGFVVSIIGVGLLTSQVRPVLPWWSIVLANALAVVLAGSYVVHRHPGFWRRLIPFPRRPAVNPGLESP
jgi:Na+-translocating ferredoxin:NAD+ oxidoreductase RnfD subunit